MPRDSTNAVAPFLAKLNKADRDLMRAGQLVIGEPVYVDDPAGHPEHGGRIEGYGIVHQLLRLRVVVDLDAGYLHTTTPDHVHPLIDPDTDLDTAE